MTGSLPPPPVIAVIFAFCNCPLEESILARGIMGNWRSSAALPYYCCMANYFSFSFRERVIIGLRAGFTIKPILQYPGGEPVLHTFAGIPDPVTKPGRERRSTVYGVGIHKTPNRHACLRVSINSFLENWFRAQARRRLRRRVQQLCAKGDLATGSLEKESSSSIKGKLPQQQQPTTYQRPQRGPEG